MPTTIDKIHADHHQQAEEMKRMLATQARRPYLPPWYSWRREEWTTTDRRPQETYSENFETDLLQRHNKVTICLGQPLSVAALICVMICLRTCFCILLQNSQLFIASCAGICLVFTFIKQLPNV
jgi:hypothetical protein